MTLETDLAKLEGQVLGIRRVSGFLESVEAIRRLLEQYPDEARKRIVALTAPSLGADLAAAVLAAFDFGVTDAARAAGIRPPGDGAPKALVGAATTSGRDITKLVGQARTLVRAGADLEVALAPLLGAAAKVRRDATTLVSRSGNAGVVAAAGSAGVRVVWVAETNACVHCLAYSGRTVEAGKAFPQGLSYLGTNPYAAPGKHPPLHPNCRCTLEVLRDQSYADALKREADRSVLRGFSLEGEPMRVRVAAAEKLLEDGVDAPKSVVQYAERAVKAGRFGTRGRPAPAAPPKPERPKPQGKDYRNMTNAEKIEAARIMYGANSPEHRAAQKKWG